MKGRFFTVMLLSFLMCTYAEAQERSDILVFVGPKELRSHLQFMKKAWDTNFTVAEIQILKIQSETLKDKYLVHGVQEVQLINQMHGVRKALGLQENQKMFRIYYEYPSKERQWKLQENENVIVFLAPVKVPGELNLNVTMFMQANKDNLQLVREALKELASSN
jgi:hypothetical protein